MLFDRVSFATSTTGTGTITAGSPTSGFRGMDTAASGAAIPNGTLVEYCIEDGTAWETGTGFVGATGTTLSRILSQSSTGSLLNLSGSAKCFLIPISERYNIIDVADPTTAVLLADDFIAGSGETGEIGLTGWSFTNGSVTKLNGIQSHPGVVRRAGSTTANQVVSFHLGNAVGDTVCRFDEFDEFTFVIKEAAAAQTDMSLQVGIMSALGNLTTTHGMYLEILPADSNYFLVTRNNSAQNRVDTGVARGTAWAKIKGRRVSATEVRYAINGGSEITVTANIPDAADTIAFGMQSAQTGTTARNMDIDFASIKLLPIAR